MCDMCNAPEHKDASEEQRKAMCAEFKTYAVFKAATKPKPKPKPKPRPGC